MSGQQRGRVDQRVADTIRDSRRPHDRNPTTPQAGLSCEGEFCTIHNPSEHHMNTWPVARGGERVCPHGIGHPDPDYLAWLNRVMPKNSGGVHGCDGCCQKPLAADDEGAHRG